MSNEQNNLAGQANQATPSVTPPASVQDGAATSTTANPAIAIVTNALITISERAAAQVKQIQERENRQNQYLRVSVVGGGCSGLSYKLSFDEVPKEKDKLVEAFGIKLVVDSKSLLFLKGTVLEFTDGLNGQGFVFTNPNAKSSCGCGSSFSA